MKILVAGHYFVKRYREHLIRYHGLRRPGKDISFDFGEPLGLPRENIRIFGKSGLKGDFHGLHAVRGHISDFRPDIVILELGTNDIVTTSGDTAENHAKAVAARISEFAEEVIRNFHVRKVVICLIVERRRLGRGMSVSPDFSVKRTIFNEAIRSAAKRNGDLIPFKHDRSVIVNLLRKHSEDDVHITTQGGLEFNYIITVCEKQYC
jgi:hypothetical protein